MKRIAVPSHMSFPPPTPTGDNMNKSKRTLLQTLAAAALTAGILPVASAQEVTLRLHQFLPPQATIPSKVIAPWIKKIETESNGRIKIQMYSAMQLGGTPAQLFDQARDGVAEITWTVLGYTPGRFVKSEVVELPFMTGLSSEASSQAFWEYVQSHAADEFKDVKLLAVHTHGPGLFHTKAPVTGLDSLKGMKIRGGSRIVNNMLTKLGATPVGMPVPAVSEALSKGVLDGTTLPWEVTPAVKVTELVKNHTSFTGNHGLYVTGFAFQMNKRAYEKLPDDLKKVIDNNSGQSLAAEFGRGMDAGDKVAKAIAEKAANKIVQLDAAETDRWRQASLAVESDWVNEVKAKGADGATLVKHMRTLMAKHAK
jgi:TRAP-type C4-dicarboxylate transport system substrate-binding protein